MHSSITLLILLLSSLALAGVKSTQIYSNVADAATNNNAVAKNVRIKPVPKPKLNTNKINVLNTGTAPTASNNPGLRIKPAAEVGKTRELIDKYYDMWDQSKKKVEGIEYLMVIVKSRVKENEDIVSKNIADVNYAKLERDLEVAKKNMKEKETKYFESLPEFRLDSSWLD